MLLKQTFLASMRGWLSLGAGEQKRSAASLYMKNTLNAPLIQCLMAVEIYSASKRAKLGIAEAKAVTLHFSAQGDVCHRCNRELPDGDEVVCPKCHSLNLKW